MISFRPSSTLFPYTTLFRSRSLSVRVFFGLLDFIEAENRFAPYGEHAAGKPSVCYKRPMERNREELLGNRSEEHTSELQSRQYLVCRLLLEKKKNIVTDIRL